MFAVIQTGGKQYRVAKDDRIVVEKIPGEPGEIVELGDVLMIGEAGKAPTVGAPRVDKAAVFAEVLEQGKGDKILVFKKQRRQNYRRTRGHRQDQTVLRVVEVSPTGTKPKAAPKKAAAKDPGKEASTDAAKGEAKEAAAEKKAPARKAEAKKADTAKAGASKKTAPKKAEAKGEAKSGTAKKAPAAKSSGSKSAGTGSSGAKKTKE